MTNKTMASVSKNTEEYKKLQAEKLHQQISALIKCIKPEEVVDFYDKWADDNEYDKELIEELYNSPGVVAIAAAGGLTTQEIAQARVLDVAAGTGLCAEQLKKKGFKHIDALDPSQGMLNYAKEKNLYENYMCDYIGYKTLDIPDDTYDLLTVCGGLDDGHIPCNALYEMIRIVKPGGHIVFVVRSGSLEFGSEYIDTLEPLVDNLEAQNKWKKLERKQFERYCLTEEGILWKFKVC